MKTLKTVLVSMMSVASLNAFGGPGVTGGGNWQEADFVSTGRSIHRILRVDPLLTYERLRLDIDHIEFVIKDTKVACATGTTLTSMRALNKRMYYSSAIETIHLDCEKYDEVGHGGTAKFTVVLHEYARRLVGEGSEYLISAKLPALILEILKQPGAVAKIEAPVSSPLGYTFARCAQAAEEEYYESDKKKARWMCISKTGPWASFRECAEMAERNYYESDKKEMRLACVSTATTIEECGLSAERMHFESDKMKMRIACMRQLKGMMNYDGCLAVAQKPHYESDKKKLRRLCLGEEE